MPFTFLNAIFNPCYVVHVVRLMLWRHFISCNNNILKMGITKEIIINKINKISITGTVQDNMYKLSCLHVVSCIINCWKMFFEWVNLKQVKRSLLYNRTKIHVVLCTTCHLRSTLPLTNEFRIMIMTVSPLGGWYLEYLEILMKFLSEL